MSATLLELAIGGALILMYVVPFLLVAAAPLRTANGVVDERNPRPGLTQVPRVPSARADRAAVVGRDTVLRSAAQALAVVLLLRLVLSWATLSPWAWVGLVAVYAVGVAVAASKWRLIDSRSARWAKRRGSWRRASNGLLVASALGNIALLALMLFLLLA